MVDENGAPKPGLLMNLVSDNPYLQDARGEKAAVVVAFTVAVQTLVSVTVEDIVGDPVTILAVDYLPAGSHQIVWNGRNALDDPAPSGRYRFRMTAYEREGEGVMFEDTIDALLCRLDPENGPVGVTDDEGRVVMTDPTLFPHLFDREPMVATDENGEPRGMLQPTEDMIFTFADTVNGGGRMFNAKVAKNSTLDFVWKELPVLAQSGETQPMENPPAPPPPVEVFSLGPVYPNPFN